MQLHNQLRPVALQLADVCDSFAAGAARARLHGLAAFARLLHGRTPIEFVAGPASAHRLIDENPLARLLHYPAASGRGKPILVVASLINRYYVMDLLPELSVFAQLNRRG